jgi:integrase
MMRWLREFCTCSKTGCSLKRHRDRARRAQAGLRAKLNHQGRGIGRAAKRAPSQLSFHSLRHTAVSLLKDAGIPQAVVQEFIGHDSEQMSALYTHVGREALERAAAALPEI